ncbi:MAG: hypothetical protein HY854_21620 [Burkholderiales bacterium]|nr:hypothetical protein [Burkholderiales bacterium]
MAGGTVIYQSYRTESVPGWITTCMQTVRDWAAAKGFEYRFIDDTLFDRVPQWLRDKAAGEICPQADIARLVVARELLKEGFERTVWVDADMLVFAPEHIGVGITAGFACSPEAWVKPAPDGRPHLIKRVNNSMLAFHHRNVHLEFLLDACLRLARARPKIGKLDLGTVPLTRLYETFPFPLLKGVGMFSPAVMRDIAQGTGPFLDFYAKQLHAPIGCANLCASLEGEVGTAHYDKVIELCLATRGGIVNDLVGSGAAHPTRKPPSS